MLLNFLLLIVGFVTLIKGADLMVGGASSLARRMKISALVIGLTVVAFGTSAPELTVNVINSVQSRNEAIFGNIIGSNIFNLLFILGVTGIISPLVVQKKSIKYEVPLSLGAVGVLWFVVNDNLLRGHSINILSRLDSFILLLGLAFFMMYIYRTMNDQVEYEESEIKDYTVLTSAGLVILGIAMLVVGGYLVTENAVAIALQFGLSEKLIGLTILAVGTSLPELATSVVAAYKRNSDIALGNVIGSNILNIFFIMGVNGLIHPIVFPVILNEDLIVLAVATIALLVSMFTLNRNKVDRWEAVVFLVMYIGYTCYMIIRN